MCLCDYLALSQRGQQALLTLSSLLAAVVQVNSVFYRATTVHMCRRQAITRANCSSSRVQQRHQPYIQRWIWDWEEQAPGGMTLSTELWCQRNGEETFTSVQIVPDRPQRKSLSACGESNDKKAGARGCFHKGGLHVLTILRWQGKTSEIMRIIIITFICIAPLKTNVTKCFTTE